MTPQKHSPLSAEAKVEYRNTGGKVTIYNLETGESATIFGIDAKERVASGYWTYEKPVAQETQAEQEQEDE